MAKNWREIEDQLRQIIAKQLGIDAKSFSLKASFIEDLDCDSLDTVELVMAFEEEFAMEFQDEDAEKIRTVEEVVDYFAQYFTKEDRKEMDSRVIALSIRSDGNIQVGMQKTDGTWLFADGTSLLPSGVYMRVFNRWGEVLKELEEMVNSPQIKERELQAFFERYPDLLKGDEYDRIIPQARIIPEESQEREWRADFMLSPFDQSSFCKILELKTPTFDAFRKEQHGHPRFYQNLLTAIAQLRDYGEAFHSTVTRQRFQDAYHLKVFKPDLQLIIGTKWDIMHMNHLLEIQRRSQMVIMDWHTTIERLRRKFT